MADNSKLLRMQQQQPNVPQPSPALPPQPSHIDDPQHPIPRNPVMPEPTPPETKPHPGF